MLNQPQILVHVGMHKTGTTWLQDHFFSQQNAGFSPPPNGKTTKQHVKDLGRPFYLGDNGNLINDDEFDYEKVKNILASVEVPQGTLPVISNERLAGHPISNGFDREIICRRIKKILPGARILLVVREQRAILLSNYIQYLRYGGWHRMEQFVNLPSDGRQATLTLDYWRYDRVVSMYQNVFGRENVLVLPYEMFSRKPDDFIKHICRFLEISSDVKIPSEKISNPMRPLFTAYYLRRLTRLHRATSANGFFPSLINPAVGKIIDRGLKTALSKLVPSTFENRLRANLKKQAQSIVADYFEDSNKTTSEMIGLNLQDYGYPVSK